MLWHCGHLPLYAIALSFKRNKFNHPKELTVLSFDPNNFQEAEIPNRSQIVFQQFLVPSFSYIRCYSLGFLARCLSHLIWIMRVQKYLMSFLVGCAPLLNLHSLIVLLNLVLLTFFLVVVVLSESPWLILARKWRENLHLWQKIKCDKSSDTDWRFTVKKSKKTF